MGTGEISIGTAVGRRVVLTVGALLDEMQAWGRATVEAGSLRGEHEGPILRLALRRFRDDLQPLYDDLTGTVEFSVDWEDWLTLTLTGDGKGGIWVNGVLRPDPASGGRLIFEFGIDQTYLPPLIVSLDAVL